MRAFVDLAAAISSGHKGRHASPPPFKRGGGCLGGEEEIKGKGGKKEEMGEEEIRGRARRKNEAEEKGKGHRWGSRVNMLCGKQWDKVRMKNAYW